MPADRTISGVGLRGPLGDHPKFKARAAQLAERWAHRDKTIGDDLPTINDFYRGRHVFMTGATGFCGKVIVEKLLHACPDIGNLYLLIRPGRGGQTPADRLQDMLRSEAFDRVRRDNPAALDKLVAVGGDCMQEGLGLSTEDRRTLVDQVAVIIHSAASVRFNDPVRKAARMNTGSTMDLVELAREMRGLKVFVHISTAYTNTAHRPTLEKTYPTEHHYKDVMKYTKLPDAYVLDALGSKFMGYQPNTYTFTKALSEQVIRDAAKDLPIVIVRPTIVTCAVEEPVPGWMDNVNGMAMMWGVMWKGLLRVDYASHTHLVFDLVFVDHVAKLTILASWAKGTDQQLPCEPGDVQVVNVSAADINAPSYRTCLDAKGILLSERVVGHASAVRYPCVIQTTNWVLYRILVLLYHVLFGAFVDILLVALKKKPQLLPAYRKIQSAMDALNYFKNDFPFVSENMWILLGMTHARDREDFQCLNFGKLDLTTIGKDQLVGLFTYALKEPLTEKNMRLTTMLLWAEVLWYVFLTAVSLYFVVPRFMA